MKKVLSLITAGIAALMAFSCTPEEQAVFDPSDATPPVLSSYTIGDEDIVVAYTPAVFGNGLNENIAPFHSLALVSMDGEAVSKTLTTKNADGKLTVTVENLSKALITLGKKEGDKVPIILVVRASMQDPSRDNGLNGYIDSEGNVTIDDYEVFLPTGDPYARYTEKSTWSVIGNFTNWSDDVAMVTNGTWHVAKGVTLAAGDEFKFRNNGSWDENLGYAEGVDSYVLGTEFSVAANGGNIVIAEDGTYDLLVNPNDGSAKIVAAQGEVDDPYAAYTEKSPWSVIGSFNSWGGDVEMYTNGTLHVAKRITLEEGMEFKFRKDADWAVNYGYAEGVDSYTLGEAFSVGQDGGNIVIAETAAYDLILDPDGATAKIIKSIAPIVDSDPYAKFNQESPWSLIGSFNSWGGDVVASSDGTWHVVKAQKFEAGTEVKFRKDADWAVNFGYADGVSSYVLGEEFAVGQDGPNIVIAEDGIYDFLLNPDEALMKIITSLVPEQAEDPQPPEPPAFEGWSVIGSLTEWSSDIDMTTSGAFWVARGVELTAADQFKFRKAHDWETNIGAAGDEEPFVVEIGVKGEGAAGGKNLAVPADGKYDLYVNPDEVSFYVMAEGEVPGEIASWGVVGTINSWGGSADLVMIEENGMFVRKDVALTTSDQFKIRFQSSWDENRGAAGDVEPFVIDPEQPVKAAPGGKNLGVPEDGNYDVWYDANDEVLYVVKAGEELPATWGVVGNITGWGGDRRDYTMTPEGDYVVYKGLKLAIDSQFKIRFGLDWSENRGAAGDVEPFTMDANTYVEAAPNGKNLGVSVEGVYDIWYNAAEEKLFVMAEGGDPATATEMGGPEVPPMPDSWGVIGTITNWESDLPMTFKHNYWVAGNLELTTEDEFKVRGDGSWDINRGADTEEAFTVTVGEGVYVVGGGQNLKVPANGTYDIYLNEAADMLYVMPTGEAPADFGVTYGEYIYAIGGDTGWSSVYPLAGAMSDGKYTGYYKGFGYLSEEFKFKPNKDNWDGDWEYDGEGKIADNGGSNCPAPTASYYMIEVDLVQMTYKLTPITTIGIIGPAQAGGWDSDTDMTYNKEDGCWEIAGISLAAGDMKFRANDAWDINWGGELDNLTQGGANIAVEAGTYDVKLYAYCDGQAFATMTAVSTAQPDYAIDGDFSEWDAVQGIAGEGAVKVLKVGSTDDMMYFYLEMDKSKLNFNNLAYADYLHLCVDNGDGEGEKTSGNWNDAQYDKVYQFWLMHDGNAKMYNWSFSSFDRKAEVVGDVVKYEWCFERSAHAAFSGGSLTVGVYVTDQTVDTSSGSEVWSENPETIGWAPAKDGSMAKVNLVTTK